MQLGKSKKAVIVEETLWSVHEDVNQLQYWSAEITPEAIIQRSDTLSVGQETGNSDR